MGGLMAFKAFGIATAVVLGSAGLGAWGVAKFLGVNDVRQLIPKSIWRMMLTGCLRWKSSHSRCEKRWRLGCRG